MGFSKLWEKISPADFQYDSEPLFSDFSELSYAWELALLPEYRTRSGDRDASKIVDELNNVFHDGFPVRTDEEINEVLDWYRGCLPEREALKEKDLMDFFVRERKNLIWMPESDDFPSEVSFAWELALQPEYRTKGGGRDVQKIADKLNSVFHGGHHVRTPRAVEAKLTRHRKPLSEREALEEDELRESFIGALKYSVWKGEYEGRPSEEVFAWSLVLQPEYRTEDGGRDLQKIADELNSVFHGGRSVRTHRAVGARLSQHKKALPEHEALEEDELRKSFIGAARHSVWKGEYEGRPSEEVFAWSLVLQPEYRTEKSSRDLQKIADELNRVFHDGLPVRTRRAVEQRLLEYKRSLPEYEALKEDEFLRSVRWSARSDDLLSESLLHGNWLSGLNTEPDGEAGIFKRLLTESTKLSMTAVR